MAGLYVLGWGEAKMGEGRHETCHYGERVGGKQVFSLVWMG